MFETLLAKTFAVLSLQLFITWFTTVWMINWFREQYISKKSNLPLTASFNEKGELDLELDFNSISGYFWTLFVVDIALFIALLFWGKENISYGLPLFSLWSISTGIMLSLSLISVDENLGARVLGITASLTFIMASYGYFTTHDLISLGPILFFALILLIIANIVRMLVQISNRTQQVIAFIGCIVFCLYLAYDFNSLAKANQNEFLNTWAIAMDYAINIYLDIINLFLDILDLLSKAK